MALIDYNPANMTVWQRTEQALLAASGGDRKLTAELLPDIHAFVVAERRSGE